MKRFFALVALVLGLAACQTEPEGLDVNITDLEDAVITVSLPEGTRGSADSSFANGVLGSYDLRYIMEVYLYDESTEKYNKTSLKYEKVVDNADAVNIPVRLAPNRTYKFVVWADFVTKGTTAEDKDLYYKTSDGLENITVITDKWAAMNEARDAFSGVAEKVFNGTDDINVSLTRPFAKLRVMTNDYQAITSLGLGVGEIEVAYSVPVCTGFNAFMGEPNTGVKTSVNKTFTYTFSNHYSETGDITLFTDFIFAKSETVRFTMTIKDTTDAKKEINSLNFNTDIPLQRNTVTTIKGALLTNSNDINVELTPGYDEGYEWPSTWAEKLAETAMFGGEITLGDNVELTTPLVFVADATINLNDHTIKGGKEYESGLTGVDIAAITVDNGATLTIYGSNENLVTTFATNNAEGSIIGSEYGVYVKNGIVNIVSGNIKAGTSAVQVNVGTANISGGNYSATGSDKRYVINCIDARWKDKSAKVNITGGTFANFNPANNVAEGAGTCFVADGYISLPNSDGAYVVQPFSGEITLGGGETEIASTLVVRAGTSLTLTLADGAVLKNNAKNANTDVIVVEEGATLTIKGNGTIEAVSGNDGYAVIANGTVNIEGGTFKAGVDANGAANAVVYARGNGKVYVKGGVFPNENNSAYVLNKRDADRATTTIEVSGGRFYKFNPANNVAEGANTNFVASGYKSQLVEGSTTDYEVIDASILVENDKLNDILADLKTTTETEIILKLAEDVTPEKTIDVPAGKDVHLNLNGQTITIDPETLTPNSNGSHYAFIIREGGSLTIDGNGTVEATTPAPIMFYPAGDLVIENGTFIRNIPEGYTGDVGSMFVGTKPAGGWNSTGVTINGGYFDCGYYPAVLKEVDVEKLITGEETLVETETDIAKRGQSGDNNVIRKALKSLVSIAFNRSNNNFLVYGGTFVGANPAWGDEGGMLPRTPNFLQPWSYYQGAFLDGQSIKNGIGTPALPNLPEGYTITKGIHEDGRPTYTVTYSK